MNTNNIITTNNIDIDNEVERMILSLRKNNITNSHRSGLLRYVSTYTLIRCGLFQGFYCIMLTNLLERDLYI